MTALIPTLFFFPLNCFCLLNNKWGINYFLQSSKLDKLSVAVGGCWWTRGLVLMVGIIGIIKNKESFYLQPLCFCSSSLDVVQWPRQCWVKGLLGSLSPSMLVSLWESWWPSTWQEECQVNPTYTAHSHYSTNTFTSLSTTSSFTLHLSIHCLVRKCWNMPSAVS